MTYFMDVLVLCMTFLNIWKEKLLKYREPDTYVCPPVRLHTKNQGFVRKVQSWMELSSNVKKQKDVT